MKRRLVLLLVSTLAALALAEGGTRLWLRSAGRPYSRERAEQAIGSVLDAMTGLSAGVEDDTEANTGADGQAPRRRGPEYQLHPYSGYVHRTVIRRTADMLEHFRSGEANTFTVLIQGGSVAAGFQGTGMRKLQKILEGDETVAGRPIRVFGLSVPGYKQPQQLSQLAYLLSLGCEPDLVLNIDGLNELRITVGNVAGGLKASFPSRGHWLQLVTPTDLGDLEYLDAITLVRAHQLRATELGERAMEQGYCTSALWGTWVLSRLAREREGWARAQEALADLEISQLQTRSTPGLLTAGKKRDVLLDAVDCWKRSSLAMHQLCEARGIRYVHLLQPTLHDLGSKPITEEERRVGIDAEGPRPAVVRGYPLMRAGLAELREQGVEALDASYTFDGVEETVYVDNCHFEATGNQLLAAKIAELMGIGPPVESQGR